MTDTLFLPFIVIGLLQIKHMICDGPLQTLRMVKDKSTYGKWQGIFHALIHVAGTLIILLPFGVPLGTIASLLALELVLHYHIDYIKENIVKAKKWTTSDGPYWWAITTDQGLHHMSYVLLAWLAFRP